MQYRPIKTIEVRESSVHLEQAQGVHNHLSEVKVESVLHEQYVRHIADQKKLIIEKANNITLIIPSHSHIEIHADEQSHITGAFFYGNIRHDKGLDIQCYQLPIQNAFPRLISHIFYLALLMLVLSPTLGALHAFGLESHLYIDWLGLISASLYMAFRGLDSMARWISIGFALFCIFIPEIIQSLVDRDMLLLLRQKEWIENILQILIYITLWKVGKYLKDHWFKSAM